MYFATNAGFVGMKDVVVHGKLCLETKHKRALNVYLNLIDIYEQLKQTDSGFTDNKITVRPPQIAFCENKT